MSISAKDIIRIKEDMKSKKNNFDEYAQQAAKFCLPSKAKITVKKGEGEKVDTDLYDSTGIDSAQILAAGLQTYLTSPYSQWFQIGFKKREHQENKELQEWAVQTGEFVYDALNSSNFNRNMAEFYRDLAVLPGATLYKEKDPLEYFRFLTIPFDEVLIMQNSRGIIDTVYRTFEYNVYEAYDRWKEKAGSEIAELWSKNKYQDKFDFVHAVAPRYERRAGSKLAKDMPFYSCFVLENKKTKIEEGGYKRNPYYIGRWGKITGETWGYTPAMISLPDMLMLNKMDETTVIAAEMAVAPPWMFPDEDFMRPMNMSAGGVNYRTGGPLDRGNMPYPMVSQSNFPIATEMIDRRKQSIEKKFFVNLFMINYGEKDKTAYEIAQQAQRHMLILGAVIGDVIKEVLEPVLIDVMQDLYEAQQLPEVPVEGLSFEDILFNYVSPLAIAQKAAKAQNTNAFLSIVMQMATIVPSALQKIDWDYAIDDLAKTQSVSPKILVDADKLKGIREAEAKQKQDANQVLMAQAAGDAMKKVGEGGQAMMPKPEVKK